MAAPSRYYRLRGLEATWVQLGSSGATSVVGRFGIKGEILQLRKGKLQQQVVLSSDISRSAGFFLDEYRSN